MRGKGGSGVKAFYVPVALMAAILAFSLWTGHYVEERTENWTAQLERADETAQGEDWPGAAEQMERIYASWNASQTFFHTIMDHEELDTAENLFAGALAVCQEQDGADFHLLLAQLVSQLEMLAESQSASIKNIL